MFGHIEEPWELAEHMRVIRELQERTGGITEFVPLSFIPFHTLLGPHARDRGDLARGEPQAHRRLPARARAQRSRNLQASWVKMGLDAATESLRWGVNDLGGTLMEETISRLAGSYHGVRLDPPDLVAAAHRAGRPAAERTTLYAIRERYPVGVLPESTLDQVAIGDARDRRGGSMTPGEAITAEGLASAQGRDRRARGPGPRRAGQARSRPRARRATSARTPSTTRSRRSRRTSRRRSCA